MGVGRWCARCPEPAATQQEDEPGEVTSRRPHERRREAQPRSRQQFAAPSLMFMFTALSAPARSRRAGVSTSETFSSVRFQT